MIVKRKTKETDILIKISLKGRGKSNIDTGIGFFNHMLELFAKHSLIDLQVKCKGDIEVDFHHTVEDVGICLGEVIKKALGTKTGMCRYGMAYIPMDESLARAIVDISGRPYLVYQVKLRRERIGKEFHTELVEEFFRALTDNAKINLHLKLLYGKNSHHNVEALFKACARALRNAVIKDKHIKGVLSTKGKL